MSRHAVWTFRAVSHVFNYDVPTHSEDYVHRIGRTGRAGREGKAMMICVPSDEKYLEQIETLIEKQIPRIDNPLATVETAPVETAEEEAPKKRTRRRKTDAPKAEVEAAPAVEDQAGARKQPQRSPWRSPGRCAGCRHGRPPALVHRDEFRGTSRRLTCTKKRRPPDSIG